MTKRKTKPATEAQKRARERNWNKGQIKCLRAQANRIYRSKTTTDKEKSYLALMGADLNRILNEWNK